jgi:hypothetical protein
MIRINGKPIWIWVLAFLFLVGVLFCAWQAYKGGLNSIFWIFGAGAFGGGIKLLLSLSLGSKICPNCEKDFTICPAVFCHNCGQPLKDSRCESCNVNWHFVASLGRESEITGNKLPIIYCPGCGTFVETEYYRRNSEPWYLRHKNWSTVIVLSFLLAGCGQKSVNENDSGLDSKLIGLWQVVGDPPSIYNFQKDHTFTITYKGSGIIIQNAAAEGNWKLNNNQLVTSFQNYKVNSSEFSSSQQGTATHIIVEITDSTMVWSNTIWRAGVSRSFEMKLNRVK